MIDKKEYDEWELGRLERQLDELKTRQFLEQYKRMKKLKEEEKDG